MSAHRPRLKVLIASFIAAIIAILVFDLATSDAKAPSPSPILSPTGSLTPRVWLPIVMNNFPPIPTTSYYIKFSDYYTMSLLGSTQGQATADYANSVIVLDVGQPAYQGSNYGAYGWDDNLTFHSTADIVVAVETYLISFYNCSPPHAYLTLVVGVNNYGTQVGTGHGIDLPPVWWRGS